MFALDISETGVILSKEWSEEALEWSRLGRKILEAVLKEEGGYTAYTSLILAGLLILTVIGAVAVVGAKQKEIDRMAGDKEKLENQVLRNRKSTHPKGGSSSSRGGKR